VIRGVPDSRYPSPFFREELEMAKKVAKKKPAKKATKKKVVKKKK
jgi:hypothetical protein